MGSFDSYNSIGSDHYPVSCLIGEKVEVRPGRGIPRWIFQKAKWEEFQTLSEGTMTMIDISGDIDDINKQVTSAIIMAANEAIPRSKNQRSKTLVPWWTEDCGKAVKSRNKAFRLVRRTHNMQHLIQYKKAQAVVRRTIRQAKRESWRHFCNKIGRTTPVGEVWGMIKRMGGDRREWEYPVLTSGEETAVSNREKAEIMAKAFVKIHGSDKLSEEERRRRESRINQRPGVLDRRERTHDNIDEPFTLAEMVRAINGSKPTSPGDDQVCYVMLKHLGKGALFKLLCLYNRVWEEGKLPSVWK